MVLIPLLWIKSCVERARCTGALSSWKMYCSLGKCRTITGHKLSFSTCWYFSAFMLPLTAVIVPTPCHEMHPQIITSYDGSPDVPQPSPVSSPRPVFSKYRHENSVPRRFLTHLRKKLFSSSSQRSIFSFLCTKTNAFFYSLLWSLVSSLPPVSRIHFCADAIAQFV